MLNLLNVASSDTLFDGEGISVSLDTTQNSAFSFNNLLSLGDKSQSNNLSVGIFDNFLNSENILEIDLKHLSQIIDKNPIISLNMKSALIVKLDELKVKFIDDGLVDRIISQLNNIKPITKNQNKSQNLSSELKERILFTPNNEHISKQKIINNNPKESNKLNANITINSIEDIEKISNEYDLNISKIKIETYENKSLNTYKNTQLQTNIDTPKMLDTSDVILFKKIKNKSVSSSNDTIKDIFTSFTNNADTKSNTVKILPTSSKISPIKEVEKINRSSFFHKSDIEDFKTIKSLKDIQILNNADFKNNENKIDNVTNSVIVDNKLNTPKEDKPLKIIKTEKEYSLKDVFSSVSTKKTNNTSKIDAVTTTPTQVIDEKIKEVTKPILVEANIEKELIEEKPTPIKEIQKTITPKIDLASTTPAQVDKIDVIATTPTQVDKIDIVTTTPTQLKDEKIKEVVKTKSVEKNIEKELIIEKPIPIKEIQKTITSKVDIVTTTPTQSKDETIKEVVKTKLVVEKIEKELVIEKPIQTKEIQKTKTFFYNYEPIETISVDNEKKITLKGMFDLKDKIITDEKHILDDTNKEKTKHIIVSRETSNNLAQKPQLMKTMLLIAPNSKSSNPINVKIEDKVNKTKLLNSLMDNSINRMAITNEAQDNKRIKTLIQELSQINKEPLEEKKDAETKSVKIQIEPLVLNEEDLNIDNEQIKTQESTTSQKSTIIDVSKAVDSHQGKEINQIMQRQIINGVYENLRYKLRNFVAPLMKFALELNPVHLGRIDVEIMVRGSSLQVSIKSSKKVSSLLEEEGTQLEKEFSVLGYKNIIMDFSGTDSNDKDNRAKEDNNLSIKKDSK